MMARKQPPICSTTPQGWTYRLSPTSPTCYVAKATCSRSYLKHPNTCQLVTWAAEGDLVEVNVTGNDLVKKYSWPDNMSKKSVPASYLVGYALGKGCCCCRLRRCSSRYRTCRQHPGGRVYAALKGMSDAGLKFHTAKRFYPDEDRVNGAHIDDKIARPLKQQNHPLRGPTDDRRRYSK